MKGITRHFNPLAAGLPGGFASPAVRSCRVVCARGGWRWERSVSHPVPGHPELAALVPLPGAVGTQRGHSGDPQRAGCGERAAWRGAGQPCLRPPRTAPGSRAARAVCAALMHGGTEMINAGIIPARPPAPVCSPRAPCRARRHCRAPRSPSPCRQRGGPVTAHAGSGLLPGSMAQPS